MKNTNEKLSRVRSIINFKLKSSDMEHPKGKSKTIEDDSWTIQELLKRHQNGIMMSAKRMQHDLHEDSDDFDAIDMNEFQNLEQTEQNSVADPHINNVLEYNRALAKKKAEEKEKASKAEFDAKVKEALEKEKQAKKPVSKTPKTE